MAEVNLQGVHALMTQTSVAITHSTGVFTVAAGVPFSTSADSLGIPDGTIVALMRETTAPNGKILQVFSIDEIITVA